MKLLIDRRIFRSWVVLLLTLLSTSVNATQSNFEIPVSKNLATESLVTDLPKSVLKQLKHDSRVLKITPVFSSTEAKWMRENGLAAESGAIKITFPDSAAEKSVQADYPGLQWSTNADLHLHEVAETRLWHPEQWNMENRGQIVRIFLDDNRSQLVKGNPKYDIGVRNVLKQIQSPEKPIRVAILDTGADADHPALKNQIEKGWNAILSNSNFTDNNGHGTHVAGIIAAEFGNNKTHEVAGIAGASGYAKILPIKVIDASPNSPIRPQSLSQPLEVRSEDVLPPSPTGRTLLDAVARGMIFALQNEVDVINLSLAWPEFANTQLIERIFQVAIQRGTVIVASAGNDGTDSRVYPCHFTGVICVGSSDADGALSYFSNYGPSVDTVAPGSVILSTWPMKIRNAIYTDRAGYEFRSGTSMASPLIAGAAALLKGQGLSADEIRRRISLSHAEQYPEKFGLRSGIFNLNRALNLEDSAFIQATEKRPIKIIWDGSSVVKLNLNLTNRGNLDFESPIQIQVLDEESESTEILVTLLESTQVSAAVSFPIQQTVQIPVSLSLPPKKLFPGKVRVKIGFQNHPALFIPVDLVRQFQIQEANIPEVGPGTVFPASATLRTVEPGVVLLQDTQPNQFRFQWVRLNETKTEGIKVERLIEWSLPNTNRNEIRSLLTAQAQDINQDRKKDFILLFQITTRESRRPVFEFRAINDQGNELEDFRLRYDNTLSILPESFEWMPDQEQGLLPVWLGSGFTPPSEVPAVGPWDQPKADSPQFRLYRLDRKQGIRSIQIPEDEFPVRLIRSGSGSLQLIVSEIGKLPAVHKVYELKDGKLQNPRPILMEHYRSLLGLSDIDPGAPGEIVFAGPGRPGELRLSRYDLEQNMIVGSAIRLKPNTVFDSVMQSLGIFKNQWAIALQLHSVTFFNLLTGQKLSLTQNRFTYMPSLLFVRNFFPSQILDRSGQNQPAVFIPSPLSVEDAFELITLAENGTKIMRPAQFRWENSKDCVRLGNPVSIDQLSSVYFRCSNGNWGQVPWVE